MKTIIAAYVYPGWHECEERSKTLTENFREWDLVLKAPERFPGHHQPRLPLNGSYDDSLPETAARQVETAIAFGIDMFIYGFFWSRGKRVLYKALDNGFLNCEYKNRFPFAIMWANRMPRGVMPVKNKPGSEIEPGRLVYTDPEDFLNLIVFLEQNYFRKSNYFRINGKPLFSIFDTTFFINQFGVEDCASVLSDAERYLKSKGYGGLHVMAINSAPKMLGSIKNAGFQSQSHYVWLPDWKGEHIQNYKTLIEKRSAEWDGFADKGGLPYYPSVSPGWDATPRGEMHGKTYETGKPGRYPWHPVVTGETPELFSDFLKRALQFTIKRNKPPITFIASWNEWSEGHYLEPDKRYGTARLQAVKDARGKGVSGFGCPLI